jgi:VIT1/CCC1 family predicted Fe2+/Mn2+ transporter
MQSNATAHGDHKNIMLTAAAGLVAGAMSMAAGEYVSGHSQADTESSELALERCANILISAARVTLWGVIAMSVTAAVGKLFGAAV